LKSKIIDVHDEMPRKIVGEPRRLSPLRSHTFEEKECNSARPNPHLRDREKPS